MESFEVKKEENPPANTVDYENNVMNVATCQIIAQMINVTNLNTNGLKVCIDAVNDLAKKLVRETVFSTRRGKRCIPTAHDASTALKYRKISTSFTDIPQKVLPLKAIKQTGNTEVFLFYPDDPELDLKELINKEPSKIAYESSLTEHWLSIYSIQPATPENPTPSYIHAQKKILREKMYKRYQGQTTHNSAKESTTQRSVIEVSQPNVIKGNLNGIALGFNGDRMPATVIDVRPHFVGTEHQVYFKTLTEACVGNDENARNNALMTIKNDKALDPLLPHLMHFITEGIRLNILYQNLAVLIYLVRIVRSLVDNPHVNLDPYLHRILPALMSVVLCGNICVNPITDNHFALRKFAGKVVNSMCDRQHTSRNELVNRLCAVLITNIKQAINPNSETSVDNPTNKSSDFTMRLNTLCGSVLCLSEMSNEAIRKCLVPKVATICQFLSNIMKLKGSTLPGAEEKAICSLKEILLSGRVAAALCDYRLSSGLETSLEACVADFGTGMGHKYHEQFLKTPPGRTVSVHHPASIGSDGVGGHHA